MALKNAIHLLLTITILGKETARKPSFRYLHLSAKNNDIVLEERFHPVIDAGTHDKYLSPPLF